MSQIYLLIFRSWIDSYSYSPQFHFMNIIPIREYINLTNIIPIHKYFSKYSWISYFLYWMYIKTMNIFHYSFVCLISFSNEKYIRVKKKTFLTFIWEKISGYRELFAITSHLTNIILIPICKFGNSRTIPFPICTEDDSPNLFLFLFAGKITIHWSLSQTLQFLKCIFLVALLVKKTTIKIK